MTYLQLVNNVLRRMREDEVTSVSETEYSAMIGDFVNDAKELVESAWDWSALRTTITITTEADIFNYILVGAGNNVKLLSFINDEKNVFMEYRTQSWMDRTFWNSATNSGSPEFFTYNSVDSEGDTTIDVYPIPDAEYTLYFNCVRRTPSMSADTDALTVPSMPVLHLALALSARERGEVGGTSTAEYFAIADRFLSDAIAHDAMKHPEETVFMVV